MHVEPGEFDQFAQPGSGRVAGQAVGVNLRTIRIARPKKRVAQAIIEAGLCHYRGLKHGPEGEVDCRRDQDDAIVGSVARGHG